MNLNKELVDEYMPLAGKFIYTRNTSKRMVPRISQAGRMDLLEWLGNLMG